MRVEFPGAFHPVFPSDLNGSRDQEAGEMTRADWSSPQVKSHGEEQAERWLEEGLKTAGLEEKDLRAEGFGFPEAGSGGVALEKDNGFVGMARGKGIDAKCGEREPAVAKVGSSESNGKGAGKAADLSGWHQDRSSGNLSRVGPWPQKNEKLQMDIQDYLNRNRDKANEEGK